MLIKIRWLGTGVTGLTTNSVYTVVGLAGTLPLVVNDSGELFKSSDEITTTSQWELVSVSYLGQVDLYP